MQIPNDVLMKFPVIFRNKIINKEIVLQNDVKFEYYDIYAYRCATRKNGDNSEITKNDFKSPAELGREKIRGESGDLKKKPEFYGVSLFKDKTQLILRLHLPQKGRKIIKGNVYSKGGPISEGNNTHVCWWLYEDADVSNFKIDDCEENI